MGPAWRGLVIFVVTARRSRTPRPKEPLSEKTGLKYWNRLYHQKPDGTFEDVTENGLRAGYGVGVAVGDYRNDDYEDLSPGYGANNPYHNKGDGTPRRLPVPSGPQRHALALTGP